MRPLYKLLGLEAPIRCTLGSHVGYSRPNYESEQIEVETGIHFHCTRCGQDLHPGEMGPGLRR